MLIPEHERFGIRDKRWSETWVVFSSFSASIIPDQTKTLVLEENMKTTSSDALAVLSQKPGFNM